MIREIMVDLETLDTQPSAHILSIGAVVMHDSDQTFYEVLGTKEQHRSVSPDTINWWCEQNQAAQDEVLIEIDSNLKKMLERFTQFYNDTGSQFIWSHGDDFDCVILTHAYKQLGMKPPWFFTATRDTRTLIETAKRIKGQTFEPNRIGVYHNALHDAQFQTKWMDNIWTALNE